MIPPLDQPYLPSLETVDIPADKDRVQADVKLKRGIWIRGRVTEAGTGNPVSAFLHYYVFLTNPHNKSAPGFHGALFKKISFYMTDKNGRYAIPGLPGRGLVSVFALDDSRYPRAAGAKQIRGARLMHDGTPAEFETDPAPCFSFNFNSLAEVNPADEAKSHVQNFQLDPGTILHGKILDPQGRPLAGAYYIGRLHARSGGLDPLPSEDFIVLKYRPDKPRTLQFWHKERRLAGWQVLRGPQEEPITARLKPWGVLTGRLVDAQGKPRPEIVLSAAAGATRNDPAAARKLPGLYHFTDKDGRFRIEGLAPGMKYSISAETAGKVVVDATVEPGETKDLGDVGPTILPPAMQVLQERLRQLEQMKLERVKKHKQAGEVN